MREPSTANAAALKRTKKRRNPKVPRKSNAATPITDAVMNVVPPVDSELAKKIGKRRPQIPTVHDDPKRELHRVVREHKRWVNTARSWDQSVSDRKNRETGEVYLCTIPGPIRADVENSAKALRTYASDLESHMKRQLAHFSIHETFLKHVYGFGPVVNSYIVTMVRPERCTKVSQLWRYCGNANGPDGKRERRDGGPKYAPDGSLTDGTGTYNHELKMRIWQAMVAMRKNAAKFTCCEHHEEQKPKAKYASAEEKAAFRAETSKCSDCLQTEKPFGLTNKYLERWFNAVHSRKMVGRDLGADHAGRRKATDLFLEDLYVLWRTLEGLPVWPDLYSVRRGFYHGGAPCVNEGKVLSLNEALKVVGDFREYPAPCLRPQATANASELDANSDAENE
jgi:hypothetical protein